MMRKTRIATLLMLLPLLGFAAFLQQKPPAPGKPKAQAAPLQHYVTLRWNPSTTPGVSYIVYRCLAGSGNCTNTGSGWLRMNPAYVVGISFNDSSVAAGTSYYYRVTAYNGLESSPSGLFLIKVPSP